MVSILNLFPWFFLLDFLYRITVGSYKEILHQRNAILMYALWPRCNRESWSEAPDRASSWGWDGWLHPTADPLPSVDQLQPHVSQSAPAAQELLNFHNLLWGPDTMHNACRLCYVVKKRIALYIGCNMVTDLDGAKVWHVNHWVVGTEGKCQFVWWWPEWLVKMLVTKTYRLSTQTTNTHKDMEHWLWYLVVVRELEITTLPSQVHIEIIF